MVSYLSIVWYFSLFPNRMESTGFSYQEISCSPSLSREMINLPLVGLRSMSFLDKLHAARILYSSFRKQNVESEDASC